MLAHVGGIGLPGDGFDEHAQNPVVEIAILINLSDRVRQLSSGQRVGIRREESGGCGKAARLVQQMPDGDGSGCLKVFQPKPREVLIDRRIQVQADASTSCITARAVKDLLREPMRKGVCGVILWPDVVPKPFKYTILSPRMIPTARPGTCETFIWDAINVVSSASSKPAS